MKRDIIEIMFGICLTAVLLSATPAVAQDCQVVTSRPEIQLESQRYAANRNALFTQQILTVTATCSRAGPVSVRVVGSPDESGKDFRFGVRGRMALTLLSAQFSNAKAGVTVISPERGKRQFIPEQAEPLSPGSQIFLPGRPGDQSAPHSLILQLRLDFPVAGDEGRIRDRTEMNGQLQFEVTQME